MNSYLYWCKKKMTLKDIEAFTKGADKAVAERLEIVDKKEVAQSEAKGWLERAEIFAGEHPDEHLLLAVRFFEVADRFKDTDSGRMAMSLSLKEMQRITAPKAVAEKPEKPPVPKQSPKTVNLLRLIDPAKDAVEGKWAVVNGSLVGGKGPDARVEIPYLPPEEYDLKVTFTRTEGVTAASQVLSKSGHQFTWVMDAQLGKFSGFETINGKPASDNKTTFKGRLISNNAWHTTVVQVRNDSIAAIVDGKEIARHRTDYSDMDCLREHKLRDMRYLGVGQNNAKITYSAIELIEITGYGKAAR